MRPAATAVRTACVAMIAVAAMMATIPSGAQTAPSVEPPNQILAVGTQIVVGGHGWAPRSDVKLEICGNAATNGSSDCDQTSSTIFGVWDDGTLHAPMTVVAPPKPCPCLIRVWTITSTAVANAAVTIEGVPDGPIVNESPIVSGRTALQLVSASVTGEASLATWFGAAAPKELVVAVRNTSQVPVTDPLVAGSWGKDDEIVHIITSPPYGDQIPPGEVRIFRVPFELDPLSSGEYTVKGSVGFVGDRADFKTDTTTFPWGLPVIALLLLQLTVILLRDRLRNFVDRHRSHAGGIEPDKSNEDEVPLTPGIAPTGKNPEDERLGRILEQPAPSAHQTDRDNEGHAASIPLRAFAASALLTKALAQDPVRVVDDHQEQDATLIAESDPERIAPQPTAIAPPIPSRPRPRPASDIEDIKDFEPPERDAFAIGISGLVVSADHHLGVVVPGGGPGLSNTLEHPNICDPPNTP